jgi:hypothetical protein
MELPELYKDDVVLDLDDSIKVRAVHMHVCSWRLKTVLDRDLIK